MKRNAMLRWWANRPRFDNTSSSINRPCIILMIVAFVLLFGSMNVRFLIGPFLSEENPLHLRIRYPDNIICAVMTALLGAALWFLMRVMIAGLNKTKTRKIKHLTYDKVRRIRRAPFGLFRAVALE